MLEIRKLDFSKPLTFAIFYGFEDFQLFDNFLTVLLTPLSILLYLTAIWVALANESINELVLSIKVSGVAILLNLWIKHQ